MRLMVTLSRSEYDELLKVARLEKRRPQDHAAWLVARGLNGPRSTREASDQLERAIREQTERSLTAA